MTTYPSATLVQMTLTFCALVIAGSVATLAYLSSKEGRNAQLVQIGVSVLETDPGKDKQVQAAREWALDLIDANAGGIRFSPEARAELLKRPLPAEPNAHSTN